MIPFLLLTLAAAPADEPLPPQAVARLGPALFHLGTAGGPVAVSPDGRRAARPGTVWNTATGRVEARYPAAPGACWAYSPDGRTLAVGGLFAPERGKAEVVLIDAATGRQTGRLPGHDKVVDFVAFSGARTLVTAGEDRVYRVWNLPTAAEVRQFPRPGRYYPKSEAVSPDGRYLATIDSDDVQPAPLHVYEVATGREVVKATMPTNIWSLAFAPDGRSLVCWGPTLYRYEVPSGRPAGTWASHHGSALACANDTAYVLTTDPRGGLTAEDVATGRKAEFPLHLPVCVAGQPYATNLLIETRGSRLEVWDLTTGRPRHPTFGHFLTVTGVALTAGGHAITADEESVHRWDAGGREEQVWPCRAEYRVYASALAPDGRTFANGDAHGDVRLWDTATGRQKGTVTGTVNVFDGFAFTPDGTALAYPGWQGLRVWDTATARKLWDAPTNRREYSAAAFTPDGRTLFSGEPGGAIREWDVTSGKSLRQLKGHPELMDPPRPGGIRRVEPRPGHMGTVISLAVSPDGRRLVSAGTCHTLRLWELATGQECTLLERATGVPVTDYPAPQYPLAFSPDGAILAAPGQDGGRRHQIDLWDVRTGRRLATLDGHRGPVTALAFAPEGRRLISGGRDTVALVWQVPPRPPGPAEAAPDESRISALWADLADADAAKAYRALGAWLAAPDAAVAAFRRLRPPTRPIDAQRVHRLVADLDADQYAVRERASKELRALGPAAVGPLRRALAKSPSAEVARRIEALLAGTADEELRGRRAIEVLEALGTPAARALLEEWAKGDANGAPAREAAAALTRLGRR